MIKRSLASQKLKTIVTFPGQGQRYPIDFIPRLQHHFDLSQFHSSLTQSLDQEFTTALFDAKNHDSYFAKTSNLQPAIVSSSLLLLRLVNNRLKSSQLEASYLMGHSLGELSALLVNEVWDPSLAPILARKRGELMENCVDQSKNYGLIALMFGKPEQLEIIRDVISRYEEISFANKNTTVQVVLSGERNELQKAIDDLKQRMKLKTIELAARVPFHNPRLRDSAYEFTKYIESTHPVDKNKELTIPIVSNLTSDIVTHHGTAVDNFIKGFYQPVLFSDSMNHVLNQGDEFNVVNLGPNAKANHGFFRRADVGKKIVRNDAVESFEDIEALANSQL